MLSLMCSLYQLDRYKREYILIRRYKGESRGGLRNTCPFQERCCEMSEKFTVEQKVQIVIESFTATNIAELCRNHGVSVAQFHRWKERFLEGGRKGLGESSRGNEYQKEIDDLKRLVGDQALVIDALKKSRQGRK